MSAVNSQVSLSSCDTDNQLTVLVTVYQLATTNINNHNNSCAVLSDTITDNSYESSVHVESIVSLSFLWDICKVGHVRHRSCIVLEKKLY